jgi:hypothetical protein
MSATVYRWKPGARIKINAKVAGQELERIRTKHNGRLTADDVLKEAKSKASPLHGAFEWSDTKAAQQFRLQQAQYLVRSIEITVVQSKSKTSNVRAFVNVRRDTDRSYTSIGHAMSDAELRQQVVAQAWKELEEWRNRHERLSEFSKLFGAIDKMAPKVVVSLKKAA